MLLIKASNLAFYNFISSSYGVLSIYASPRQSHQILAVCGAEPHCEAKLDDQCIPQGQSGKGSFSNAVQGKPMDIDNPVYNILRILPNTGNNKKAQKPKGKCYAYRKLRHFARNYRSKNKINRTKDVTILCSSVAKVQRM